MTDQKKPLCIYHHNCIDGFAAAWVFKYHSGLDFDFHPGVYSQPPPDVTGRDVYLVDFSYKRIVVEEMLKTAKSIALIDHHKTAIEDLQPLIKAGDIVALTDVEHSGAMLAWKWFKRDKKPPKLLKHIEDRDLWKFALPGTREVSAALFSYPYDFEVWNGLMQSDVSLLVADGTAIERKHHKDIAELVEAGKVMGMIGGYYVWCCNLPYIHSSDAGHLMAKGNAFSACYWFTPKGVVFSLRSTNEPESVDVSEIAKKFGGGGHRNAAGFTIAYSPLKQFFTPEISIPGLHI